VDKLAVSMERLDNGREPQIYFLTYTKLSVLLVSLFRLILMMLLYTGTPGKISPMKSGDVVEVEIEGIGILKNRVA
jgi:hypothetical protein